MICWKKATRSFGFFVGIAACLIAPAQAQSESPQYEVAVSKFLMGTRVEATVIHDEVNEARRALFLAFSEMERVEKLLSVHLEQSEISEINRYAGIHPVQVSRETFDIVQRAKGYAEKCQGLFDISIGPITTLWGFSGDQEATVPDSAAIASLLSLVNFHDIGLHASDTTIFLTHQGMQLDLGGIAKGYAIDRAVGVLHKQGIENFLLNAGGDLYVSGRKDEQQAWNVGIKHPRKPETLIARLEASNIAIATSGDYERFIEVDGHRYHHILDPRTGFPVYSNQSITTLAATAEEADVLATYLFILGLDNKQEGTAQVQHYFGINALGKISFTPSLTENHALTILEED